jgi:hypothetical protein
VFIYRTPTGDLRDSIDYRAPPRVRRLVEASIHDPEANRRWEAFITEAGKNQFIRLLGIHTAQYSDQVTAKKIGREQGRPIRDGDELEIPNSMTVVAPAWEIVKLLDLPVFQEQRRQREETMKRQKKKANDPEPEAH